MSVATSNYPTARLALRAEITSDSGGEDVYGWAADHAGDIFDLMTLAGLPLPVEVDYVPPTGLTWDVFLQNVRADLLRDAWAAQPDPDAADEALAYWARVLTRYLRLPAVAALAY